MSYILFQFFPPLLLVSLAGTDQDREEIWERRETACSRSMGFFLSSSGKIKSKKSNLCHKAPSTCGIFTPLKGVSSLLLTSAQALASHLCLPSWLGCKCEELPVTLTRRNSLLFQIGFFYLLGKCGQSQGSVIQVHGIQQLLHTGGTNTRRKCSRALPRDPALSGLPANLVYSRLAFFLCMKSTLSWETEPRSALAN